MGIQLIVPPLHSCVACKLDICSEASCHLGTRFWEQESLPGDPLHFLLFPTTRGASVVFLGAPPQDWHGLGGGFLIVATSLGAAGTWSGIRPVKPTGHPSTPSRSRSLGLAWVSTPPRMPGNVAQVA